ncbi:MAG TPA: glucosaminidase domain-containing protein [Candidatus Fermentibacter daniensis]|nr:MAG: Mannosyl-glycoprotein endo-beta-N-acetylglucosaminidase [candidate division Hyd24-12 bacterium ADurb.Bin004]HOF67542.1 glucosaminidase domain-containing protein [Candidatus Fermentibacter daniensis]HOR08247.1 glucosaminidase domain-containing protein [Candidatus Fermentibacter daniensis]HOZ17392.1 glucosaminidase domain-containing protein [Candidatus Fermentibacter daniensis]HPH39261.1 glucosaminidase domain-containing protein [Candidatus Fermentibacter daniensis]
MPVLPVLLLSLCSAVSGEGPIPELTPPVRRWDEVPSAGRSSSGTPGTWLIMGEGLMTADRLAGFLLEDNPDADSERVLLLATLYIEECAVEGVNSDVAFVQMCHETGFLRFGGLVTGDMNNFCGLGSTGPGNPGLSFPDERTGVRAHVQHLKAYGSTEPLVGELVDPRFGLVSPRGRAPDISRLSGTWAADRHYAERLAEMLGRLYL